MRAAGPGDIHHLSIFPHHSVWTQELTVDNDIQGRGLTYSELQQPWPLLTKISITINPQVQMDFLYSSITSSPSPLWESSWQGITEILCPLNTPFKVSIILLDFSNDFHAFNKEKNIASVPTIYLDIPKPCQWCQIHNPQATSSSST